MRDYPLIYSGRAVKRTKAAPVGSNVNSGHTSAPEVTEQKGYLLIRDLWQQGTGSVHNMCAVNTDGPLFPEVPDKKVSLLFRDLWR